MTKARRETVARGLGVGMLVSGAVVAAAACVTNGSEPLGPGVDAAFGEDTGTLADGAPPEAASDAGYSLAHCPNGGVFTAACSSCIQSSCAAAVAAVNTACASTLACACPLGVDAAGCSLSTACASAVESATTQCSSCESACVPTQDAAVDATLTDAGAPESGPGDSSADAPLADAAPDAGSDAAPDAAPDAALDASATDASLPSDGGCPTTEAGVLETNCGGTCVDLTSDPQNCGACSAACQVTAPSTAACNTSRCLLTLSIPTLSSGDFPDYVSVVGANVYYATTSENTSAQIDVVPVGGGTTQLLLTGTGDQIAGIAATPSDVYWVSHYQSRIMDLPLDGGTSVTVASGASCTEDSPPTWNCPNSVALLGSTLFFTATGPWTESSTAFTGYVESTPVTGGSGQLIASDSTNGGSTIGVAANATQVFWHNGENLQAEEAQLDGGAVTTLVSGVDVADLTADPYNVYYVTGANVVQQPLDGGAAMTLATGQQAALVAVDSTSVYWANTNFTDTAPGAVVKVPIGGGTTTTLVSGLQKLWAIAADGTNVYVGAYSTTPMVQQLPAK